MSSETYLLEKDKKETCPECGCPLVPNGHCMICPYCGWGSGNCE